MTKQQRRFFSAQTVEQAVVLAARHYGVDPKEISYREVEKRHGFLKVRRSALIEVDPEAVGKAETQEVQPRETEDRPYQPEESVIDDRQPSAGGEQDEPEPESIDRPEPQLESGPPVTSGGRREMREGPRRASDKYPPAEGEIAEAAREAMEMTLELADLDLEFAVLQGDERLEIELWGADDRRLLADRGQVLLAIQLLMPRLIRGRTGVMVPCRVDCGDFHEIREERLRDLAQTVAGEVRHGGRSRKLRPMSPDERRIVHITLADDPAVTTESEGDGLFKRVRVSPA